MRYSARKLCECGGFERAAGACECGGDVLGRDVLLIACGGFYAYRKTREIWHFSLWAVSSELCKADLRAVVAAFGQGRRV